MSLFLFNLIFFVRDFFRFYYRYETNTNYIYFTIFLETEFFFNTDAQGKQCTFKTLVLKLFEARNKTLKKCVDL